MSKITNVGLSRSGTGCFMWKQWWRRMVNVRLLLNV